MANRHFAKLADVWKHLALAEILAIDHPQNYWETHAGNAIYSMVEDRERRYGALRFAEVGATLPSLAHSSYLRHLRSMNATQWPNSVYPGSPMLGMLELGAAASYLFCDTDLASVNDLKAAAARLELETNTDVVKADGMTTVHNALDAAEGTTLVHIDPYDPWAAGSSGLTALDLAGEVISRRIGLVYWYGYSRPDRRAWALDALSQGSSGSPIWCGDVTIASHGVNEFDGDLGVATTPGTGFGIVCANVSSEAIDACGRLGEDLALAYEGVPLPDGTPGYLDYLSILR